MANAQYTLVINGEKHGFRMDDVDFSADRDSMAYGLGETVVDSMQWMGVTESTVVVSKYDPELRYKGVGLHVKMDPESTRHEQVVAIGRRLADATYKALEGAAA